MCKGGSERDGEWGEGGRQGEQGREEKRERELGKEGSEGERGKGRERVREGERGGRVTKKKKYTFVGADVDNHLILHPCVVTNLEILLMHADTPKYTRKMETD